MGEVHQPLVTHFTNPIFDVEQVLITEEVES